MQIILARHGAAEEQGTKPDPERALVDKGRAQAAAMGKVVAATLGVPGAVWSSPLRRAVETARAAMVAMGIKTEPKVITDLGPGGDPEHLAWLAHRGGADVLMLVGHQPDLGAFGARLLGLKGEVELKKGAICIVETTDATRPQGRAVATLAPDQYEEILAGRQYAPWMRKQLRV
jgi:phosphohistidine phosphatase